MASPETATLRDQVREHTFANRLELAELVAQCSNEQERIAVAKSIVQQIAMQRVFDRFTKEQEEKLLDVIWPHANPEEGAKRPLLFGHGAKTNLPSKTHVPPAEFKTVITQPITIELPEEFIELCKRDHTSPETVLRGFIADLCSIENLLSNPRDDGYNSNGSDERQMAWDYYDRAGYNRAQFGE